MDKVWPHTKFQLNWTDRIGDIKKGRTIPAVTLTTCERSPTAPGYSDLTHRSRLQ